ncbi:zinc finger protein 287-like [Zerene cesonia]|uniref:zinc finger protein 287-like n=1 Tax=Zerene cesonia TaxID=33412 RepID=UPI0018E54E4B|nr:zinc finger protein 287-like [Zerene cesonia]
MATTIMKLEVESETCSICGSGGELSTPEEYDAGALSMQVPLRTMLLQINNNKVVPEGRFCSSCIRRTVDAYEFSSALSARSVPPLSEKIRNLRRKLLDLTQKIDVFIVVGGPGVNSGGSYSEDDLIMVEKDALAAAASLDDEDMEKARNAVGESVYQCTVCPMSFQRASEYRAHVSQHGEGARHSCWTCGAQFGSAPALADHAALHAAPTAQACHACPATFQTAGAARAHAAVCAARARCEVCGELFPTRALLAAHAACAHPPSLTEPALCPVCLCAVGAGAAAAHALAHRQADRFVCGYDACILRFPTRNDLLAHIRSRHAGAAGATFPFITSSIPYVR